MFQNTVIVSAVRTAVGTFGGSLKNMSAIDLGTHAASAAVDCAGISPQEIDEVVLGCVGQYGLNAFLARLVGLNVGCDIRSTGQTVNRLCASGLQAVVTAAMMIENGDISAAIAGGAESMSNYPYLLTRARFGMRMGVQPLDLEDALTTALCEPVSGPKQHICITAENIAKRYGFTRQELDQYALESQRRALDAIAGGLFRDEIVPIEIHEKKGNVSFDTDEHPRHTTLEKLSTLRPLAGCELISAGNSSGINDASAALVLMSRQKAAQLGCRPIARIVDYAIAGVEPAYMGLGPIAATRKLLNRLHLSVQDIGLVELNEAYASQAMACIQELELDPQLVNVNGSGIALGHPIGATGALITVKLLHEMQRRKVRYGLSTLCIGGGQGMSVLFEQL